MLAKLTVYRIDECGYYARGQATPTCCALLDCLGGLRNWIVNVQTTVTGSCAFPGDDNGTHLAVYCLRAAAHGQNDFLITTWNEMPSENGAVGAVDRSAVAASADVQSVDLPENSIPGYGTHFWFLGDQQRLVTVRFDSQPLNGHAGLNFYMRGYLERFSPHVRWEDDTDEGNVFTKNIIGYAVDGESDEADPRLRPRFKSVMLRRSSEITYIRRNRTKISKVIRKGRPTVGGQATRSYLDRALTTLFGAGQAAASRALPDRNFMFEISYTPTAAELNSIITNYQQEEHETWDDIGFDFTDSNTRRWLSNSTLKVEVELPDELRNGAASIADAQALLEALQPFRDQVSV